MDKKKKKDLMWTLISIAVIVIIFMVYFFSLTRSQDAPRTTAYLNEQAVYDNVGVYIKNLEAPQEKELVITIHVTNYNKNTTRTISRLDFELNDTYTLISPKAANFYGNFELLPQTEYDFTLTFYTTYSHENRIYTLQWQPNILDNPINLVLAFREEE